MMSHAEKGGKRGGQFNPSNVGGMMSQAEKGDMRGGQFNPSNVRGCCRTPKKATCAAVNSTRQTSGDDVARLIPDALCLTPYASRIMHYV